MRYEQRQTSKDDGDNGIKCKKLIELLSLPVHDS